MPVGLTVRLLVHTALDGLLCEGHEEAASALGSQTEASAA
jgi:hypothetical protein